MSFLTSLFRTSTKTSGKLPLKKEKKMDTVVEEMLGEFLEEHKIRFVPVRYANKLLSYFAHRNPNAAKYIFDRLGWKKKKFAWGGQGSAHAFYHPDAHTERGMLQTVHYKQSIEAHLTLLTSLLSLNPDNFDDATTHIIFSGCRTQFNELVQQTDKEFERNNTVGFDYWKRDKALLGIASKAHEVRTQRAWDNIFSELNHANV